MAGRSGLRLLTITMVLCLSGSGLAGDSLLAPGRENTLMLRVVGPIFLEDKRIGGLGPLETPQWRGGIVGGIWQPVRLILSRP